jgi:hypothetical protein
VSADAPPLRAPARRAVQLFNCCQVTKAVEDCLICGRLGRPAALDKHPELMRAEKGAQKAAADAELAEKAKKKPAGTGVTNGGGATTLSFAVRVRNTRGHRIVCACAFARFA